MHRINDVQQSLRVLNDEIVMADEDKFGVRHDVFFAVRSANGEWPTASQLLSNKHAIHALFNRLRGVVVKGMSVSHA